MTKEDRLEIAKEQIKDSGVLVYRSLTRCSIGAAKIHVENFKVVKDNNILFDREDICEFIDCLYQVSFFFLHSRTWTVRTSSYSFNSTSYGCS